MATGCVCMCVCECWHCVENVKREGERGEQQMQLHMQKHTKCLRETHAHACTHTHIHWHTHTHKLIYGDVRSAGLALCLVLLHIHFSGLMAKQTTKPHLQAKTCWILLSLSRRLSQIQECIQEKNQIKKKANTWEITEWQKTHNQWWFKGGNRV